MHFDAFNYLTAHAFMCNFFKWKKGHTQVSLLLQLCLRIVLLGSMIYLLIIMWSWVVYWKCVLLRVATVALSKSTMVCVKNWKSVFTFCQSISTQFISSQIVFCNLEYEKHKVLVVVNSKTLGPYWAKILCSLSFLKLN